MNEHFHLFDEDGSGTLDREELRELMRQQGHRMSDRQFEAFMARVDVDGSGTLEREEIAMLATKMGRGLKSAELDSAMEAMDADGNGSVDFDEFYECKFASGSSRLAWLWR